MLLRMNNKLFKVILQLINKIESKICLYYAGKMIERGDEDFRKDKNTKKAVIHILKEVMKKDPKAVSEFLIRVADADGKNTRWIVKGGMNNLSKNKKKRNKNVNTKRRGLS